MKVSALLPLVFATQITATSIYASLAAAGEVCCQAESPITFKPKHGQTNSAACAAAGGTLRQGTCNCENFCGN
ncbi:hypothetical protein E6O75_ATG03374 [Venturia nashicola]|uniref:Uncharacterized protein n=1 Tax=Venturia nashicola TaxID=86259 RepID=A0A4Z1P7K0_9PEZI|nr:hypothetical protein E6O75_ATG03374 [Venturia nashicola]